jgi:hypothetical protein
MNTLEKLLGNKGCYLIVGSDPTLLPTGYAAYAVVVRIDDTEITEVDEIIAGERQTLDDATWEGVAFLQGEFIPFANPVVSFTLTNETDSVLCYLQPTDWMEAPTGFTATLDSEVAIDLDWTNNTNEDGIVIERSLDGLSFEEVIRIPKDDPAVITYKDEDLEEETKYYYRIKAYYLALSSAYTDIDDATTETIA